MFFNLFILIIAINILTLIIALNILIVIHIDMLIYYINLY